MTEKIKAYANYPHLTESDILVLIDIDRRLKESKQVIDFSRRKGIDQPKLKKKVRNLTYKKRRILFDEITVNISGIKRSDWETFGELVENRSKEAVRLIKEFILNNKK